MLQQKHREGSHIVGALAVREGKGIEARARRAAWYWRHHLLNSQRFISASIDHAESSSVLVLGAGRLLDFPLPLPRSIRSIHLVDIDSSAVTEWQRLKRRLRRDGVKLSWEAQDVTGRVLAMVEALTQRLTVSPRIPVEELGQCIRDLALLPKATWEPPRLDTAVSLNMLSQLAIGCSRALNRIITAHWQPKNKLNASQYLSLAAKELAFLLEVEHAELLGRAAQKNAVVISDTVFYRYEADGLTWSEEGALSAPFPETVGRFMLRHQHSWLWHLAPCGIEFLDHGLAHRVLARDFCINIA